MHCHLGFLPQGSDVAGLMAGLAGALNCTVTPEEYAATRERFAALAGVRTGVGLHPWYVDEDPAVTAVQCAAAASLVTPSSFVGEIGLDFGPKHAQTKDAQTAAFSAITQAVAAAGECVLSLHSVQATETVLDILDANGIWHNNRVIFHWYSGSSAHLHRALQSGAYFSVNPRMLLTKRGREYARAIPVTRLLLETDLPDTDGALEAPLAANLQETLVQLASIRNADPEELAAAIAASSAQLLRL